VWHDNPKRVLRILGLFSRLFAILFGVPLLLDLSGPNSMLAISGCNACLGSLSFLSPNNWWADQDNTFGSNSSNEVLHYHNGTWQWELLPIDGILNHVLSMSATDTNNAWATYHIFNDKTSQESTGLLHEHNGQWDRLPLVADGDYYGLVMLAPSDGWAIATTADPPAYQPISSLEHYTGSAWQSVLPSANATYYKLAFAGPNDGWVVGDNGFIAHDIDGIWHVVPPFTKDALLTLQVRAANDVWVVGNNRNIWHYDGSLWHLVNATAPLLSAFAQNQLAVLSANDYWVLQGESLPGQFAASSSQIWHYTQAGWQNVPLSGDDFTDLVMLSPTEGWAVGVRVTQRNPDGEILAGNGVIAHYQNGVWHVSAAPREAEALWVSLLRGVFTACIIAGLLIILWLLSLSTRVNESSLLNTRFARITLLFSALGLGGLFLVIAEPFLSMQYNIWVRLIGYCLGFVGSITAIIYGIRLERKHNRTPTLCPTQDLFQQSTSSPSQGDR
jgi:hypothetical protein